MGRSRKIAAVLIAALALAGCNHYGYEGGIGPREGVGTVAGALAGGVIGNQFGSGGGRVAATVAGAVVGGLIGGAIGRDLDERDRQLAYEAEYRALEYSRSGTPVAWRNPDNGRYGSVVTHAPYRMDGYDCRDYTHTIYIDGRPRTARGTACRQPDGTWRPVG